MCKEHPHKIVPLIIPILICYIAFCRNIFINIQAAEEDRQMAKWGMLEGLRP
jgi:hypothetical protein